MRPIAARLAPLLAMAALLACGGPVPGDNPGHAATVAARASEPRVVDPTAGPPAPDLPPPGGGGQKPAPGPAGAATGSASAKTPAPPPVEETAPPKKISARHVLIQWMGSERAPSSIVRTRDQALAIAEQVHARAHAGEDFARLAVEYSDEPGAGGRGGSLGRFGRGAMVPSFDDAAFKLKVGGISAIVETGFGFHVIQRTE